MVPLVFVWIESYRIIKRQSGHQGNCCSSWRSGRQRGSSANKQQETHEVSDLFPQLLFISIRPKRSPKRKLSVPIKLPLGRGSCLSLTHIQITSVFLLHLITFDWPLQSTFYFNPEMNLLPIPLTSGGDWRNDGEDELTTGCRPLSSMLHPNGFSPRTE